MKNSQWSRKIENGGNYKLKKTGDCSKTEKLSSLLNQKKNINVSVVSNVIKMLMSVYVYTQIMEIKLLLCIGRGVTWDFMVQQE